MNVLITGANGYIGRHVVAAVCDLGHNVIACDIQF
ncbi:MAG: NAD(P)-dependent oxidoreductase, partial [Alistipes sp.]|nr:NAD(P)-dependent oxidoreductase [Alistipes sp.]